MLAARPESPLGVARLSVVVGARPNFMKVAPILRSLTGLVDLELVHTGQHYDDQMSEIFFRDLGIPKPDVNLGIGSGTHAEQTAAVLTAYERLLLASPPDAVLVVGDVNSTLAASLAAAKVGIPVAHVEAGLRSGDWSMPEEVNRVLTDRLSTWLFTYSEDADRNLEREGIETDRIHLVGNVMIDTLLAALPTARLGFGSLASSLPISDNYAVMTLHRPSNLESETLLRILGTAAHIARTRPVVFPIHPRTRKSLSPEGQGLLEYMAVVDPLGYLDFIALVDQAALVLTDSGGLQEEASVLGIPCVTLRDNTERPITITHGTNVLGGTRTETILKAVDEAIAKTDGPAQIPLWDGQAAGRLSEVLLRELVT